jgi:hypothetical protein
MAIKSIDLVVWGTVSNLPIEFSSSVAPNYLSVAEESVRQFANNSSAITEGTRTAVESYIKKTAFAIGISTPGFLTDCVKPHMLLVRVDDDGCVSIALLCGFKYDPEHDIAIVFRNQELVEVGSQDIVVWW